MLRIFNTLTRKIEEFKPINPQEVGMYTCGPTVYDYMHIGNLRTFIMSDTLYRILLINDYKVKFIQNITDIEDKIIKKSAERNESVSQFTQTYTKYFLEDLDKLNIIPADNYPKATDHIEKMVKYIEVLQEKGFAYKEEDGSVYFDISKFPNYGKLSGLDKRELKTGTRILSDEYDKENVQDFALWKSVGPAEIIGYDSPWGRGRPGWHIECSVMSQEYLGDTFDIHAGGIDLIFPHHENEIAQSEAKTGRPFVNYFVHGEHLLVDGKKMSKSANNFYTLNDLQAKGFEPLALRYLFLTAHYHDSLNFTWESLQASQNALNNLRDLVRNWDQPGEINEKFWGLFMDSVNNNLNTPQALAVMWNLAKLDFPSSEKARTLLEMDKVLGLKLEDFIAKKIEIPDEVQKLVEKRETVRTNKDFAASDQLRKEIQDLGFEVKDTPNGPELKKA